MRKIVSLRLRGKILLLFVVCASLLVGAAAWGFWRFNLSIEKFEQVAVSQKDAVEVVGAEAEFKKQVQEWKDTIIRGSKPDLLKKHWGNFQDRETGTRAIVERLRGRVSDPQVAPLLDQFLTAHKSMGEGYRRGLKEFSEHNFETPVADAAVAGVDRAPTELLTKAKDILVAKASALAVEAKEAAEHTMLVSIVLLAVMTAVGVTVFFLVTQWGIAKPLVGLNGVMQAMTAGNLDVAVPGKHRGDEIGSMAKAVQVFKENAERVREMEAEQARNEARAAEEREAAMAQMARDFETAVGGIVQAAVAGNFSQRVDLDGKSGLILNVGGAINALCENVAHALNDLVAMLGALANGDMTKRITADYQGNFEVLKDDANKTASQIGATIGEIKSLAREVANAAIEISGSTTTLSQRTEEQAASLEETSASMEQMSATVNKNAENAQAANQSAAETRTVAERGGDVVGKAVEAMARIEESSGKIADIIGVIDEIARQTNLLALNAAVEAARAGEAGRGFAVVASEVRSLAQRSSQAAKDIKDLITSSTGQVKEGVDLVNRAGTSLGEIVASIKNVVTIVAEIASASAEQAGGIEQINKALTQMDQLTQQNSAIVEENAAIAKSLENRASVMDERIASFKLAEASASDALRAKPARAAA